ncbi:hypothetical protein M2271_001321 [Streptomyces sp. LBL]|uniref:DUF6081 family protein n=1 Tax=Streptomyces sp. LBL TaxID=2940562 RepID=UPI00247310DF|nr:DUF6081 family protein [Streptomyces sp. LBL]MDH6623534.1 hypothetical protein [Streptomyces sp. LBL]
MLFEDDFREDWAMPGRAARWRLRPLPWLAEGDGRAGTPGDGDGLCVESGYGSAGREPPAFTKAPEGQQDSAQLRWAAFARPEARGPGPFRAEAELSARVLGADRHPDGDGPRCAMAALICVDMASGMAFDFALTDGFVWALYERLPRPGSVHGSFAYAVPLTARASREWHRCAVEVDPSAGRARWSLEGEEVFAVDRTGLELDARAYGRHLEWSTPGPRIEVAPDRLALGLGLLATSAYGQGVRLRVRRVSLAAGDGHETLRAAARRQGAAPVQNMADGSARSTGARPPAGA